jgi:hypothetical protein
MAESAPAEASGGASWTSSPYVAGPGPGFDPNTPPEVQPPPEGEQQEGPPPEDWDEAKVSDWLKNAGDALHAGFGIGEYDWALTRRDLERIAPPMTRILNRYEPTRAVARFSDPLAVALGMGMYGWRSVLERSAVLRARAEEEAHAGAGLAPGFEPPPPVQQPAPMAPAPAGGEGNGQPATWADQLRGTRSQEEQ